MKINSVKAIASSEGRTLDHIMDCVMLDTQTGEVNPVDAGRVGDDEDELRIYIVIRRDIGDQMSKAKFGVQCAHAALTTFVLCQGRDPERAALYMRVAQAKIVLQVPGEVELRLMHEQARAAGFDASLITDAGRTEFTEPTTTGIAIGPIWWRREAVPSFLRKLPTYRDES